MPEAMDPSEVKAFAERWRLVAAAGREALLAQTGSQKLEQLASLMASAHALGWISRDPAEEEAVRDRWLKLAAHYRA
jgi:hypothetical protein